MAIVLLIILLSQVAAALKVDKLEIEVVVDGEGFASVTENYFLSFISDFEFNDFKQNANKNSASLSVWQASYDFFKPHFTESAGNKITSSGIIFDETSKTLQLKYGLTEKFATLLTSEQRSDTYSIPDSALAAFNIAGTIVIPENTRIVIRLPENTEVDTEKLPDKVEVAFGNQIVLNGIQSNSINIQYSLLKPIAPKSDEIVQGISNTYIFAPLAVLLLIGTYAKREEIEKIVEDYIVNHSEMKPRESEEIEIDFGK